jgi:hypothetical protein
MNGYDVEMDKLKPHHGHQLPEIPFHANRALLHVIPVQARDKLLMFMAQFSPCRLRLFTEGVHNFGIAGGGAENLERLKIARSEIRNEYELQQFGEPCSLSSMGEMMRAWRRIGTSA